LSHAHTYRLREGSRVRLKRNVESFPSGIFPAGLTGTLVKIGTDGDYWVRLDQHFPNLEAWNNELQLWHWSDQESSDEHPSTYLEVLTQEQSGRGVSRRQG
jgi:hypothetical protein